MPTKSLWQVQVFETKAMLTKSLWQVSVFETKAMPTKSLWQVQVFQTKAMPTKNMWQVKVFETKVMPTKNLWQVFETKAMLLEQISRSSASRLFMEHHLTGTCKSTNCPDQNPHHLFSGEWKSVGHPYCTDLDSRLTTSKPKLKKHICGCKNGSV